MKNKTKVITGLAAFATSFLFAVNINQTHASEINTTYALTGNEGSPYATNNKIVVAHETGVPNASAENNAIYEKRTWPNAYVQYIVGNDNQGNAGKIFQVGQPGYVSYGAGTWANANAPVQIELAETSNPQQFRTNYVTYVNLLRESAKKYGIPLTLDNEGYIGVKSHNWISQNVWGDHSDPYGYLDQMGVSKAQFAHDVQYGIDGKAPAPSQPIVPEPSKPVTPTKQATPATSRLHVENGTFTNGDTRIQVRYNSKLSGTKSGMLPAYASVKYYGYVIDDGYVWIVYTGFNGKTLYCPVRPVGQAAWGTFK